MKTILTLAATIAAVPASAQVMTPAAYVATAGASDLYERTASELVLESTTDATVRSFAQMMVSEHGKSSATVKAAARRARVRVPAATLTPLQGELIAQLRGEMGAARDATYVAQQKAAHGQALAVQQAYAADGSARALKAAAARIVPVVQRHIAMLKGM